jgi:hypothetical protein
VHSRGQAFSFGIYFYGLGTNQGYEPDEAADAPSGSQECQHPHRSSRRRHRREGFQERDEFSHLQAAKTQSDEAKATECWPSRPASSFVDHESLQPFGSKEEIHAAALQVRGESESAYSKEGEPSSGADRWESEEAQD